MNQNNELKEYTKLCVENKYKTIFIVSNEDSYYKISTHKEINPKDILDGLNNSFVRSCFQFVYLFAVKQNQYEVESKILKLYKEFYDCKDFYQFDYEKIKNIYNEVLSEFKNEIVAACDCLNNKTFKSNHDDMIPCKLKTRDKNIVANGIFDIKSNYVVFYKDSVIKLKHSDYLGTGYLKKRDTIIKNNVEKINDQYGKLLNNQTFDSLSAAATILLGAESNGWVRIEDLHGNLMTKYRDNS